MMSFFEEFVHVAEITIPLLLQGIRSTLEICILSIMFSLVVGFGVGYMCLTENRVMNVIARVYIKIFRCTPFMVQVYIAYYGLPTIGIRVSAFWSGVIILSLYTAAYLAVILESGIKAIAKGQAESAYAMGMSRFMTFRRILFPQSLGIILPSLTGQLVQTVKDSSILSIITVEELTMMTKKAIGITFSPLIVYLCAGVFYWVINIVIEVISGKIEKRNKRVNA